MKFLLIFLSPLLLLFSCATEKPVNFDQLQDRSGLFYLVNEEKPFTGEVVRYTAGRLILHGYIKEGVKDGTWTEYFPNGQKMAEGNYKEGLKDGTWTVWKDNGEIQGNEVYRFGNKLGNETPADTTQQDQSASNPPEVKPVKQPTSAPEKPKSVDWERLRGGPVKYLDGIPYSGPVVKYFREGGKELDGYFKHGKRTGKWTFYDRYGNIKDVRYY